MVSVSDLSVKIFADGADRDSMCKMYRSHYIKGFTTNPTLMRRAGITDYEAFALDVLETISDRPISFEVFADDALQMEAQARRIASWGKMVFVKIPVMNTRREPMYDLVRHLSDDGIQVNVTALLTLEQVRNACKALKGGAAAYVSVFAGRIADTGRDPVPVMSAALELLQQEAPNAELIWASPRELLNIFQADQIGCHVLTATADLLNKLELVGKDLTDYSLETVQMFHRDAVQSQFALRGEPADTPHLLNELSIL